MLRELIALHPKSKAWIYQSDRELNYDEIDFIRPKIFEFVDSWSSHGSGVDAYGNIFHKRFIGFFADQTSSVSGCSIDSSVKFVRQMGADLNIDFFQRTNFAFLKDEEIFTIEQNVLASKYDSGNITDDTFVFDNLVNTKEQFLSGWLKPFNESWHYRMK